MLIKILMYTYLLSCKTAENKTAGGLNVHYAYTIHTSN